MKYNILYWKYKYDYYIYIIFKKIMKDFDTIENRADTIE